MTTRRLLQRIAADERGVGVIELALTMPAIALLMLGASDLAMGYSAQLKLQQAAARTMEMATAGGYTSPAFQNLQSEAATAANVATGQVTVTDWLECDGTKQSSCATGQQYARFASVSINGSYHPMFGFLFFNHAVASDGGIAISGKSSVRVQ